VCFYLSISVSAQEKILVNVPDWPPYFSYFDNNQGFAIELIDLILTEAGYKFEFIPLPVTRGNVYIKNGNIDVSVLSYNKSRDNFVYYNDIPLFSITMKLVTRHDTKEIDDISQLNWLKFEFVRGLSYTKEINSYANTLEKNVHTSVTLSNALKKIQARRSDVTAASQHTLRDEIKKINAQNTLRIGELKLKTKRYYITVSKRSLRIQQPMLFLKIVDEKLTELHNSNVLAALERKYNIY